MPILCQQDVFEAWRDAVDDRNHLVAAFDGKRAAGQEIVLDVDDEKDRVRPHQPTALPISSTTFFASPNTIIVFGM